MDISRRMTRSCTLGVGNRYQIDLRIDFPGGVTKTLRGVPTNTLFEVLE
jgi:hypothetical protein